MPKLKWNTEINGIKSKKESNVMHNKIINKGVKNCEKSVTKFLLSFLGRIKLRWRWMIKYLENKYWKKKN